MAVAEEVLFSMMPLWECARKLFLTQGRTVRRICKGKYKLHKSKRNSDWRLCNSWQSPTSLEDSDYSGWWCCVDMWVVPGIWMEQIDFILKGQVIQSHWDVILCHWRSGFQCFGGTWPLDPWGWRQRAPSDCCEPHAQWNSTILRQAGVCSYTTV